MANKTNHIQAINTANLTRSRQKYIRGKTRSASCNVNFKTISNETDVI